MPVSCPALKESSSGSCWTAASIYEMFIVFTPADLVYILGLSFLGSLTSNVYMHILFDAFEVYVT